jgi:hypothetical protein
MLAGLEGDEYRMLFFFFKNETTFSGLSPCSVVLCMTFQSVCGVIIISHMITIRKYVGSLNKDFSARLEAEIRKLTWK